MSNVRQTTQSLLGRLPKLNYLVLTPGFLTLKGRDETSEGMDKKLALNYYARWKFVQDLMPLLEKAKAQGEDARVLTVLAAGSVSYDISFIRIHGARSGPTAIQSLILTHAPEWEIKRE